MEHCHGHKCGLSSSVRTLACTNDPRMDPRADQQTAGAQLSRRGGETLPGVHAVRCTVWLRLARLVDCCEAPCCGFLRMLCTNVPSRESAQSRNKNVVTMLTRWNIKACAGQHLAMLGVCTHRVSGKCDLRTSSWGRAVLLVS